MASILHEMLRTLQSKTGEEESSARRAAEILIFKNIATMLAVQKAAGPVIATFSKSEVVFSGKDNKPLTDKQITLPTKNTLEAGGTKTRSASEQLRHLGTKEKMENIFNGVLGKKQHFRQNIQETPLGANELAIRQEDKPVHKLPDARPHLASSANAAPLALQATTQKPLKQILDDPSRTASSRVESQDKPKLRKNLEGKTSNTAVIQLHPKEGSQAATVEKIALEALKKPKAGSKTTSLNGKKLKPIRKDQNSSWSGILSPILDVGANILKLFS